LEEAAQFLRDSPNGQIFHHIIVHPPDGEPIGNAILRPGPIFRSPKSRHLRERKLSKKQ
jgi:hypothetical protein